MHRMVKFNIHLYSLVLRSICRCRGGFNLTEYSVGNDVDMNEAGVVKEGRLNTKDCLHSLALLRRAKWFGARANSLQNCVLTIRVMRDFCLRNPVWSSLELWV